MQRGSLASPAKYPTFVEWLRIAVDRPNQNILTVDFSPNRGSLYTPTIGIGKIDNRKFMGSLGHAGVNNSEGRWIVDNVTFRVNEKKINHTQQMNFGLSPPYSRGQPADRPLRRYWRCRVNSSRATSCTSLLQRSWWQRSKPCKSESTDHFTDVVT